MVRFLLPFVSLFAFLLAGSPYGKNSGGWDPLGATSDQAPPLPENERGSGWDPDGLTAAPPTDQGSGWDPWG